MTEQVNQPREGEQAEPVGCELPLIKQQGEGCTVAVVGDVYRLLEENHEYCITK